MLKKFFNALRPVDIVAIVCIIGGFYLLLHGIDTIVGAVILGISAYYFGHARKNADTENNQPGSGNSGV